MPKDVWVKVDWPESWEERKKYITASLEAGAEACIVPSEDVEKVRKLGNIKVISNSDKADFYLMEASSVEEIEKAVDRIKEKEEKIVLSVEIADKELEKKAVEAGRHVDNLIIISEGWKVIPLENIIADLQGEGTKIIAGVIDSQEAKTAVETLEVGADGVLLNPEEKGVEEIRRTCEVLEDLDQEKFDLVGGELTKIESVGMGDRVCVDTTSIMDVGEGMLVGSQSSGFFLVHSESLESEYVEPRPFRVNAGPVHAYIQVPGGETKYLSEIESGDSVLVVNSEGDSDTAIVGRVKIERRPLLLVEAEYEGRKIRTLLQNAETINLVREDGSPVSVSDLEVGEKILINLQEGGRHFGTKVEETLIEK